MGARATLACGGAARTQQGRASGQPTCRGQRAGCLAALHLVSRPGVTATLPDRWENTWGKISLRDEHRDQETCTLPPASSKPRSGTGMPLRSLGAPGGPPWPKTWTVDVACMQDSTLKQTGSASPPPPIQVSVGWGHRGGSPAHPRVALCGGGGHPTPSSRSGWL